MLMAWCGNSCAWTGWGSQRITSPCPVFTSLWKKTWWKKPPLDHELKNWVYLFLEWNKTHQIPKHWALGVELSLMGLKLASKQLSSPEQLSPSHMAAFLLLLCTTTTGSQCPARSDLAAFFCPTGLFVLLPKTEQPAAGWARHLALQGWIDNHNKIFVRLSESTMCPPTPVPCICHFKFTKSSSVFHSICYVQHMLYFFSPLSLLLRNLSEIFLIFNYFFFFTDF